MTRDKAIEAMDRLNELGYSTTLLASVHPAYVSPDTGTDRSYSVGLAELGVDKVDLKALVDLADELDLDVGYSPPRGGFSFGEPDRRPEVVRTQRKHPRPETPDPGRTFS